jgi:uncharacterized protein involved in outer membrane biogenesis
MKKILFGVGIGLIVLVIAVVLAAHFFLDGAIKRGVETVGSKLTQVDVKLTTVQVTLLSGSGQIKGLTVGNPAGYKTPQAISVGTATLSLQPGSLLGDKVVIKKIEVIAPEITFEGGFGGNNLSKIMANVNEATSSGSTNATESPTDKKAAKKLEVDDFVITGAKLHVDVTGLTGQSIPIVIPNIHLTDLGTGPEGITAAELTKRVLSEIQKAAIKAADTAAADLGKGATDLTKDLGKSAGENVNKLTKGLGGLLKKPATNTVSTNAIAH